MSENNLMADKLLKAIQEEERDKTRGRLKIFFGYAAGVGKTYAMLKAAHEDYQHIHDGIKMEIKLESARREGILSN